MSNVTRVNQTTIDKLIKIYNKLIDAGQSRRNSLAKIKRSLKRYVNKHPRYKEVAETIFIKMIEQTKGNSK